MPLQRDQACRLLCIGRAAVAGDEVQHNVVPGRRRSRAHQFLLQAGDHEHAIGVDRNGPKGGRERARLAEVRCAHAISEGGKLVFGAQAG